MEVPVQRLYERLDDLRYIPQAAEQYAAWLDLKGRLTSLSRFVQEAESAWQYGGHVPVGFLIRRTLNTIGRL